MMDESEARCAVINACREINEKGLNQNASGNVSIRYGSKMLISPSAIPYDEMTPDMIAVKNLSGGMTEEWEGPLKPSTEWRFHWMLLNARSEINAVVHAHPPYCTALAILRRAIPACHYMVAAFGGDDVRCAGYAPFGTQELANLTLEAMRGRSACLLANHGMVSVGESIEKAMWRAIELEALARQFHLASLMGNPILLSSDEINHTLMRFGEYRD